LNVLESRIRCERALGQIEQPRPNDRTVTPHLRDLVHVEVREQL